MTDDTTAAGGTYTLCIELLTPVTVEVGALGTLSLCPGWYAYTGSALGPGGFSRIRRHRELAAGERDVRHWHVDYLLGHSEADLDQVIRTAGVEAECPIARSVGGDRVPDFGASDCDCASHLHYSGSRADLLGSIRRAHASAAEADGCCPGH